MAQRSHRVATIIGTAVTAAALGLSSLVTTGSAQATDTVFRPQVVTVDTPTRADKRELQSLGLDLTEHAGHDYIEVVLHNAADLAALVDAGFTYDVRIADLVRREARNNEINKRFAATTVRSSLPSGRDSYRMLADYNADMQKLAEENPRLVKLFELPHKSLDGRTIYGIEITEGVKRANHGQPTFVMLGVHHAREWPSGEHTMEFAIDLVNRYKKGHPRITELLRRAQVIIVPVVNVDGFELSRSDGEHVDLRELDEGGTVSLLGTPGNAYKRKNCRVMDGEDTPDGSCRAFSATSPGGFGIGVDPNRNYGGFWGGPGASDLFADPTYRGAGPFSEPETQNIRELVTSHQVTTLITNHTYSNLVLRPNGASPNLIGPDGFPLGNPPDEKALKALGDDMAAENGYTSQHAWELYDTTGSTEDWSYNATGGFGYTFEIGPTEFHPPFPTVIDLYYGDNRKGDTDGLGNRDAFLLALENAVDSSMHSVISGKAPAGATLRLEKRASVPTWSGDSVGDRLRTTMQVGSDGKFTWHVNPSTPPIVQARQYRVLAEEPTTSETFTGTTAPSQSTDIPFKVTQPSDILRIKLDWPTPDDLDLYLLDAEGNQIQSSAAFVGEKEEILLDDAQPGDYIIRVTNFASATPTWTVTAEQFDSTVDTTTGLVEQWTLSCLDRDGRVLEQMSIQVDRGEHVKANLMECRRRW